LAPHFYETWPFYGLCGTVLLTVGGSLHFLRMRGLRRIEQLERLHALEQQRTRIARDLHDDLGADLSRLAILSERLRLEGLLPEASRSQLQTIAASSREMVESIRELVWATDPRNDLLENLAAYVREYVAEVIEDAGLRARLDFAEELPRCPLSSEFRRNVFLAVKEALANVLKHARATEVTVVVQARSRHQLEICVADNGQGFDPLAVGVFHNGLRNLRQRLEAVGGTLTVNAASGQGTAVQMRVPLVWDDGTSTPRA
jgi:signal transduction histidine kinase